MTAKNWFILKGKSEFLQVCIQHGQPSKEKKMFCFVLKEGVRRCAREINYCFHSITLGKDAVEIGWRERTYSLLSLLSPKAPKGPQQGR